MDTFSLHMERNIHGDPIFARKFHKDYTKIDAVAADIFEFVKNSGEPDEGLQSLTIVLISNRRK